MLIKTRIERFCMYLVGSFVALVAANRAYRVTKKLVRSFFRKISK